MARVLPPHHQLLRFLTFSTEKTQREISKSFLSRLTDDRIKHGRESMMEQEEVEDTVKMGVEDEEEEMEDHNALSPNPGVSSTSSRPTDDRSNLPHRVASGGDKKAMN
ncbi:hypothetical protein PPACK8108_LOCUS24052 [Phakopsora pachyrhizi]|uniref:Uncharacterized protein n=1 Tax=Phakopsora pachyrhizi TaxID=170000 RepID=A0AAV0BR57_PHAPC|nr:hypothetical protein PPACK8108_LOCUS24052 [Phakopsora pachyrhizi]